MFRKPTVLIIGAGANKEFGLPLGTELMTQVGEALRFRFDFDRQISGDRELLDVLKGRFGQEVNTYTRAANHLVSVLPGFNSMDEALHFLRGDEKCTWLGKVANVQAILKAERNSSLKRVPELGGPDIARCEAWAYQFLKMVLSSATFDEIKSLFKNLTVVNFNYDRCFEHYLYWALQSFASAPPEDAVEIVANLNVIRPYGDLGKLDWDQRGKGTPFGGRDYHGVVLFEWAKGIRTYTEQDESDVPVQIEQALTDAELILILGFGFHEQNVQLLRPKKRQRGANGGRRHVFATIRGIAEDNKRALVQELTACFKTEHILLSDRTATQLLFDLAPSIMAVAGKP
ncbi:MAG: hypothetical protein WED13_01105 [Methyloceanibacter sp.]